MESSETIADSTKPHPDVNAIVSRLDDKGYCVVPSVIDASMADEVRSILAGLLDAELDESHREQKCQRVGRIAVKHPVFLELMCHPVIVAVWKQWLGPDIICSTWSANTLYPGHADINWHADYPYWSLQTPWPTGKLAGQTISGCWTTSRRTTEARAWCRTLTASVVPRTTRINGGRTGRWSRGPAAVSLSWTDCSGTPPGPT